MKLVCPDYVKNFRCIADKCTDSCCIGWEIGIDEATAEKYKSLKGEIGKRMSECLCSYGEGAVIRLKSDGRCPFLDSHGLCDIIKEKGDSWLSEICREHPRFYNELSDWTEWGVGLSCEAAARLILNCRDTREGLELPPRIEELKSNESFILFARDEILKVLYTSDFPLNERLMSIIVYAKVLDERLETCNFSAIYPMIATDSCIKLDTGGDFGEISSIFELLSDMEYLDPKLKERIVSFSKNKTAHPTVNAFSELMIIRIAAYFIYRYFTDAIYDDGTMAKVKFAITSALVICMLAENSDDVDIWIKASISYSKEMEYNEDNRDLFYEMCFTEKALSTESMLEILLPI